MNVNVNEDLLNRVENISKQVSDFKEEMKAKIKEVPDNLKINRIDSKCFTINFKNLEQGNILSPSYYDNLTQAEEIIKLIDKKKSAKEILEMLKKIAEEGFYMVRSGYRMRFNHQVRDYIKSIIEQI